MPLGVLFEILKNDGNFLGGKLWGSSVTRGERHGSQPFLPTRERSERKYIYISSFPSYRYFVLRGKNERSNTRSFAVAVMMVIVQFRSQFGSHLKAADEAVYG